MGLFVFRFELGQFSPSKMKTVIIFASLLVLRLAIHAADADGENMIKISRSLFKKFRFPGPQTNNSYWVFYDGTNVNVRGESGKAHLVEVIDDWGNYRRTSCTKKTRVVRYNVWESTLSCSDGSVTVATAKDSLKAYVKATCTRQLQLCKYRHPAGYGSVTVCFSYTNSSHCQTCS